MADEQKEIQIILSCNSGVDFSSRVQAEQLYVALIRNSSLTSPVGRKYVDKLKAMLIAGSAPECFLCGAQGSSLICPSCVGMLREGRTEPAPPVCEMPDEEPEEPDGVQDIAPEAPTEDIADASDEEAMPEINSEEQGDGYDVRPKHRGFLSRLRHGGKNEK